MSERVQLEIFGSIYLRDSNKDGTALIPFLYFNFHHSRRACVGIVFVGLPWCTPFYHPGQACSMTPHSLSTNKRARNSNINTGFPMSSSVLPKLPLHIAMAILPNSNADLLLELLVRAQLAERRERLVRVLASGIGGNASSSPPCISVIATRWALSSSASKYGGPSSTTDRCCLTASSGGVAQLGVHAGLGWRRRPGRSSAART